MPTPMAGAAEIAAALMPTARRGHPVEEGLGDTFVVGEVDPARVLEMWKAARAAMPVTGRWPVFTLPGALVYEPGAAELAELDRAARTVPPWSVYRRRANPELCTEDDIEPYVQAFLGADLVEAALDEIPVPTTTSALQRWT